MTRWLRSLAVAAALVAITLVLSRCLSPDPGVTGESAVESGRPSARVPTLGQPKDEPGFSAGRIAFRVPPAEEVSTLPPHPAGAEIGGGELSGADEAKAVLEIFRAYREAFGSYPSGETNAQLTNALRGANADRRALFPRDHERIGGGGELIDGFGTAYFFHLVASDAMEVRSAGADREFYTADDLVASDVAR
ncbi:MAG: hypothetical protein WA771_01155 [Chthoniobacterales bacterium]